MGNLNSFKTWLKLSEMAYAVLPNTKLDNNVELDYIDFRFEDYPEDTDKAREVKTKVSALSYPFYAKFPQTNTYLHYDGKEFSLSNKPGKGIPLPDSWWEYASIYKGNKLVKPPKRMRISDKF
jgi:hypothetical protein